MSFQGAEAKSSLAGVIAAFESRQDVFWEQEFANALWPIVSDAEKQPSFDESAEHIAFSLFPKASNNACTWPTHYGPQLSVIGKDGELHEFPNRNQIAAPLLDYWSKRAQEAKHPVLKNRYADLVWDLRDLLRGYACPADISRIVVDSAISLSQFTSPSDPVSVFSKLRRALSIAISISDQERVMAIARAIISFEDSVAKDHLQGLWGHSFDLLLEEFRKSVRLEGQQRQKIVDDLEARLARLASVQDLEKLDPHCVQNAALRLAHYYRRTNQQEDLRRVLNRYADAFERKAAFASAPMVGAAWMHDVHKQFLAHNLHAEAEQIAVKYGELAESGWKQVKPMTVFTANISAEQLEAFLAALCDGDADTAIARLVSKYVPLLKDAKEELLELSERSFSLRLFGQTRVDHKGRTTAQVESVEKDLDGNIVIHIPQGMGFVWGFVRSAIVRLIRDGKLSLEWVLGHLDRSPLFKLDNRPIIEAGLRAYFDENWIVAIHVLVPQIECAVRNLVEACGGATMKKGRNGAMALRTLDELLRDEVVTAALTEDVAIYLQILMTDQRSSWNVRNNVCHGFLPALAFDARVADRVLHAVLLLGYFQAKNESDPVV